jgi:hypothetical protein
MQGLQQATRNRKKEEKEEAKGRQIAVSLIIRLRRRPRVYPWGSIGAFASIVRTMIYQKLCFVPDAQKLTRKRFKTSDRV